MTTTTERAAVSAETSEPPDGWETWALPIMREVRREGQRRAAERRSGRSVRVFPLALRFREGGRLFVQRFTAPYRDPREIWLLEEQTINGGRP